MTARKLLEGEMYMILSLLMPYIIDLLDGLNHALGDLKLAASADGPVEIAVRKAEILCMEALVEDFDNCWGDGEGTVYFDSLPTVVGVVTIYC